MTKNDLFLFIEGGGGELSFIMKLYQIEKLEIQKPISDITFRFFGKFYLFTKQKIIWSCSLGKIWNS